MAAAKIDLGGPEFDFAGAEIVVPTGVKALAGRALGCEENVFDLLDLFLGQVIHADTQGAGMVEKVLHAHALYGGMRLVAPLAKRVEQMGATGQGNVKQRSVDVLW